MAIFAKYDGIDGESKDDGHPKWVTISSLDWDVHRAEGANSGASRRRGRAIVEDMALMMDYDKASPKLLEKALTGAVIPNLTIELTATHGGQRATYLKYEMKNVMITSHQFSASGTDEDGPAIVMVEQDFDEIQVTYTEFSDDGSALGNVETSWKRDREEKTKKKKNKK